MSNGVVYTIPKGIKPINISIGISDKQLKSTMFDIWKVEVDVMLERNKDILRGFSCIGHENIIRDGMKIRLYCFIDDSDLTKCSMEFEGE